MPCGLAAMVFGALFGEVFGFHGLVSPLWMKPLDDPLAVLAIPMGFGVVLMLLGLAFAGFEAHWRGELRAWLLLDAAVLLLYVSLLAGVFTPRAFWFTGLAIGHYFIGALVLASAGERGVALLNAAGQLLLSIFELAMNTLSFLRVGAFALAHAAMSLAILTLADGVDSPWAWGLIILLGNLFGVVMEGLLVFVQTTRLVLFEFFIRFLHAEGRLFRAVGKVPGGSGKGN
jgi:V/A-type H+-transporting ATPase subunit I